MPKPKTIAACVQELSDRERIDLMWPEHDRTSCHDTDLNNAGGIFTRYRCERCESLSQLQAQELREQVKGLNNEHLQRNT